MYNGLDRSLARTGSSKEETIWNNTERKIVTIGKTGPIETKEPVAKADVAGTQFTAVADRTGASGLDRNRKRQFRRRLLLPLPVARP